MSKTNYAGNYFPVGNGNFVVHKHYQVNKALTQKVEVTGNIHHIFVLDASSSMHYEMSRLSDRFIELAENKLKDGDTLTVLLFNHAVKVVFKHFLIRDMDVEFLKRTVKKQFVASGLTGFKKPIDLLIDDDILAIMDDWKEVPFKLYFMSDGYDNQSGSLSNILDAFSKLKGFVKAGSTHVEGFSEYYDRSTLMTIAQHMSGVFVHTTNADIYMDEVESFINGSRPSGHETKVEITDFGHFTFMLNLEDGLIVMLEKGTKEFSTSAQNFMVVTYTQSRPVDMKKVSVLDEAALQAAYSTAIVASRYNKLDEGIKILDIAKDPFFAGILDVSLTPHLFSLAEEQIREAIVNPDVRYQDGQGKYLKNISQIDVPTLLRKIAADAGADGTGAKIQKPLNYSPISFRPSYLNEQENGRPYGKFVSENPEWATLSDGTLIFDDKTANMSIQFTETGHVEISDEDVLEFNLQKKIKDIHSFKRYTLFDGKGSFRYKDNKGINAIFVKNISQKLYDELRSLKAIHGSASYAPNKVFRIKLEKFPIVNRKQLMAIKSVDYASLVAEQKLIEIENRAIKTFYEEIRPPKPMATRFDGDELIALADVGNVDANGYYRGQTQELNHTIAKAILDAANITDITAILPEYTTKKNAGKKKPFDKLTATDLKQLLVDANLLHNEMTFKFDVDLRIVNGETSASIKTVSSMSALRGNLLYKGNFVERYLIEKGINVTKANQDGVDAYNELVDANNADPNAKKKMTKAKVSKIKKDAKPYIFKAAGIDIDSFSIVDILATKAGQNAAKGLSNPSEILLLGVINTYIDATKGLSETEKVAHIEAILDANKVRAREISFKKFLMKLAYIIGKKGFSDNDRMKPVSVTTDVKGHTFEFTPIVNSSIIYSGSLSYLLNSLGLTLEEISEDK